MNDPSSCVDRLLVVGTGTMGSGIAQVAAQAGCTVWLYDQADEAAKAAKDRIAASLQRAADKGYVDAATIAPTLAGRCKTLMLAL